MLPSIAFIGLPWQLSGKESACNAGDLDSVLGLGRSPEGGHGNPLQYSGEFHGQRSLVGYSPWGHKESDTTEATKQQQQHCIYYSYNYVKYKHGSQIKRPKQDKSQGNPVSINIPIFSTLYPIFLQFSSVAQSCPTVCDPMNRSTPGLPVHHQLLEFTQTHVH